MRLVTSIVRPDRVDVVKGALGRIGVTGMTVQAIIQAARMGEIGDGRVFVIPVEHGCRIRTGEMELA